jgi:transposase-like protein
VSARVSPTDRIRAEIDALFTADSDLVEVVEQVARLGARLIIQTALEAEVTEFLGRARYQRHDAVDDARLGSRNGYAPVTVKTTAGPVTLSRPKLRGTTEAYASRLFGAGVTRTSALESLVIAGFVRGLSVRDVEASLADALGAEAALSKSTVSRACAAIRDEFDVWRGRRLDDVVLDYLFLNASHFRMHPGARAEPVLAAWGIRTDGKPVFVGLAPAAAESTDGWAEFLTDLRHRGLRPPLLVISDGAPGLITAVETTLPASLRQRCLIHRARNLLAKIPAPAQAEVKAAYWALFDTADLDLLPGPELVAAVQARLDEFADRYRSAYPAAVRCLLTDREQLTAYLRFPVEHHPTNPTLQLHRAHLRGDPPPSQGDRPAARRTVLPVPRLRRPGPGQPWLARPDHVPHRSTPAARPPPRPARSTPRADPPPHLRTAVHNCRSRRLT